MSASRSAFLQHAISPPRPPLSPLCTSMCFICAIPLDHIGGTEPGKPCDVGGVENVTSSSCLTGRKHSTSHARAKLHAPRNHTDLTDVSVPVSPLSALGNPRRSVVGREGSQMIKRSIDGKRRIGCCRPGRAGSQVGMLSTTAAALTPCLTRTVRVLAWAKTSMSPTSLCTGLPPSLSSTSVALAASCAAIWPYSLSGAVSTGALTPSALLQSMVIELSRVRHSR
mmetsp:Transcript_4753/g.12745  ORF Transcript_4753/g.12745 Transcript_4753/m.12745 type:complete len:225 (+) Transcript_4753:1228-1902(+)